MKECDVCVIGGGPAGSVAARRLAQMGHEVCLIEEQREGRKMVGESLGAPIATLLEILGLLSAIETGGFIRCAGARVRWAAERIEELPHHAGGFLINRARFDRILQQQAEVSGVQVIQPARARARVRRGRGGGIEVVVEDLRTGGLHPVRAAFVIDATGRRNLLGGERTRLSPRNVALCGYWQGVESLTAQTLVEAAAWGWAWGAPLPGAVFSAITFSDPLAGRFRRGESAGERYQRMLTSLELFSACRKAKLIGEVKVCDAGAYLAREVIGDGWVKIGEAAFAVDPLSSQGVQAAIRNGFQAAIVVNTILRKPERRELAESFFADRVAEAARRDSTTAAAMYAACERFASESFWRRRAAAATPPSTMPDTKVDHAATLPDTCRLRVSPHASLVKAPAIDGEFVEAVDAIVHPSLERPVAYLGNRRAAPLLSCLERPLPVNEMLRVWGLPPRAAQEIMRWMWERKILIAEDTSRQGSCRTVR